MDSPSMPTSAAISSHEPVHVGPLPSAMQSCNIWSCLLRPPVKRIWIRPSGLPFASIFRYTTGWLTIADSTGDWIRTSSLVLAEPIQGLDDRSLKIFKMKKFVLWPWLLLNLLLHLYYIGIFFIYSLFIMCMITHTHNK